MLTAMYKGLCGCCLNPEVLEDYGPDGWCKICHRFTTARSKSHLDYHACVTEKDFHGPSVIYHCVNPVRIEKSSDYLPHLGRCNKRFLLPLTDYEKDRKQEKLALDIHSWIFQEECARHWAEVDRIRESKRPAKLSEEEIVNHPDFEEFLKWQEKTKI